MGEFWLTRKDNGLFPDSEESVAAFASVPFGKSLRCEVKQPRSAGRHKLYWALCARIAGGIGRQSEEVSDLLKIACGHCTTIKSKTMGTIKLPKSIAWHKMDETEFRDFFERAVQVIYEEWGIEPSAVADLLAPEADHAHR